MTTTFYGAPDNDPPGPATAYSCGGRNYVAGGTGTYANPLTFATVPGEYTTCEIVYFPYLRKYLRMEDSCADCSRFDSPYPLSPDVRNHYKWRTCTDVSVATDLNNGKKHIYIWTGSAARLRSTARTR